MTRNWSKFDEMGLARFVYPEAAKWLRLPVNRADLLTRSDGRRRLVEVIYTALLEKEIRYAPEQYHPELAEQVIRAPIDILSSPGEGTCLDLATTFAGICLGYELIPVVVVTETHALCAISLIHGTQDWDGFDRAERDTFDRPVTDPAVLRNLVEGGSFLAVECTGFAHSETLPSDSIEGAGRTGGILSFLSATEAGRRQLDRSDSPLRFAIDVAVAHYSWKIAPPLVPPELTIATERLVAEQVAAGLRLDRSTRENGIKPYPRPVTPMLRPARPFLDRRTEADRLLAGVAEGATWLTGPTGMGKTTIFRHIAHSEPAPEHPDGRVYVSQLETVMDASQQVFDSFFDAPHDFKPSLTRIGQLLRDVRPLLMIDGSAPTVAERLADLMPRAGVIIVPGDSGPGGGSVVTLGGLPEDDAVDLFANHLGRSIAVDERPQVLEICRILGGHPARIVDAARALSTGAMTIEGLAEEARRSIDGPSQSRYSSLDDTDGQIVDLLAAFNETGLLLRHIEALIPGDVAASLSRLATQGVVATSSPRYRLAATAMGEVVAPGHLARSRERAVTYFEEWVSRSHPEDLAGSLPEIREVMSWAASVERWGTVVALGTAAESAASLTRQWGVWGSVLEATRTAAVHTGDRSAEALALHQLGSRSLLLGDRRSARSLLRQARRIRRGLGDTSGAQLSAHNLRLAGLGWVPWVAGAVLIAGFGVGTVCATTDLCSGTDEGNGDETSVVEVEVSPREIDFGEVPVGAGGVREVEVSNDGSDAATITGSIEGDPTFTISGTDCPLVIEPGGSCRYVIAFAPATEGPSGASFVLQPEGGDAGSVDLRGVGLAAADVAISPGVGEFSEVPVGGSGELNFDLLNQGGVSASIIDGPSVEGEFFSLVETDCEGTLDPGGSCHIVVRFTPERQLGAGTEPLTHDGRLVLEVDPGGGREVPLQGVSFFELPDLTVELGEATPIGRQLVGNTDVVVVRVISTIRNTGVGPATGFRITGEQFSDGAWVYAAFSDDPGLNQVDPIFEGTLDPGEELPFPGFVLIPRSFLDARVPLPVRLLIDSCAGEEFQPFECRVVESNEENNYSPEIDANPIVGRADVSLERNLTTIASADSNTANLVADALLYYASVDSEAQDTPPAVASIVDSGSLTPPDIDPGEEVGPGELYALQLVDLAPRGRVAVVETDDSQALSTLFGTGADQAPSGDFLHVSEGSYYFDCSNAGLETLILSDWDVVSGGVAVELEPLPLVVSDSVARGLDFPTDTDAPRIAEVLLIYVRDGLAGVVGEEQYPEGGQGRFEEGACID